MSQEEGGAAPEAVQEDVQQEDVQQEDVQQEESSEEESGELSASQEEELANEVEQAIEDGATKEEVQQLVESFKIKVNGQEKEVELNWNNKEDIARRLQMAEAAQEAMRARAETEKIFIQELNRLKDNPWDVLQDLGLDPDELAEARIAKQIEELQKSPEQRQQEERDRELQQLREELKRQQEEKEKIEFEQLQKQAEMDLEKEINEAISATSELPKSQYVKKRIADTMAWAIDNGRPDVTPQEVIPIVEKEINSELNDFFESMPDKVLEKFMGKKVTDRLRKQRLAKMPQKKKIVDTGKKVQEKPRKRQSLRDFAKRGFSD